MLHDIESYPMRANPVQLHSHISVAYVAVLCVAACNWPGDQRLSCRALTVSRRRRRCAGWCILRPPIGARAQRRGDDAEIGRVLHAGFALLAQQEATFRCDLPRSSWTGLDT